MVPKQNIAADKTLATAANLKLTDFPTGWTIRPAAKKTADARGLLSQVQSCFHSDISALDLHGPTRVLSPLFAEAGGGSAFSSVDYRATKGEVQAAFHLYRNAHYIRCVTSIIGGSLKKAIDHAPGTPSGLTTGAISVNDIALPPYGNQSLALRIVIPLLYQGQRAGSTYFDDVTVQKGRAVATVEFTGSSESPIALSLEERAISAVTGRLVQTGPRP